MSVFVPDTSDVNLHLYSRDIDAEFKSGVPTSLVQLCALINEGERVLDLGCGVGALGKFLGARNRFDGLTISEDEAVISRNFYENVVVADLDNVSLEDYFDLASYDAIVCADVIEHIKGAARLLDSCKRLLKPDGKLLLSVPNIAYAGLIAELMGGEFRYRPEGLMDETHLRFFTRASLYELLGANGWEVQAQSVVRRELIDSEFGVDFKSLPPAVREYLLALPDSLTYQFILLARPSKSSQLPQHIKAPAESNFLKAGKALFTASVYFGNLDAGGDAVFDEDRKLVKAAEIGKDPQFIHFDLPHDGFEVIRLDPAEREGFIRIYEIQLFDASGALLWELGNGLDLKNIKTGNLFNLSQDMNSGFATWFCSSADPWLILNIEPNLLKKAAGGALVMKSSSPASADYYVYSALAANKMAHFLEEKEARHLREKETLGKHFSEMHEKFSSDFAKQQADFQQNIAGLESEFRKNLFEYQNQLENEKNERAKLEQNQAELEGGLRHELAIARNEMQAVLNLKSVRYTRKIANLIYGVKRKLSQPAPIKPAHISPQSPPAQNITPQIEIKTQTPRENNNENKMIDIAIPVYKGLADVQLCVGSVLASDIKSPHRILIINDASPEEELTKWLRDKAANEPRITLLENEQNLGFVGTANRAMSYSDENDVILLNSDTEVANNWLDKLQAIAYGQEKIASVTPFSNNATICSYPNFCQDNPLPAGESTASLDKYFQKANAGQSISVPTGVGFCMYIPRAAIKEIGLFDEKAFGKGYGEENDFCQRAQNLGWKNLHALDTFVRHTGGGSFGESKSPRELAAMQILEKMHPSYPAQVADFVSKDPAKLARMKADWLRISKNGEKKIVISVCHAIGGGTMRHVKELAYHLKESAVFFTLQPANAGQVRLTLLENDDKAKNTYFSNKWAALLNTNELSEFTNTFKNTFKNIGLSHIHYHHLLGHQEEIWNLPAMLGVEYDFTTHDFYPRCTNITMTGTKNRYEIDEKNECCGGNHPMAREPIKLDIQSWRAKNRAFLENARHVLAPSIDTANRINQFFPTANAKFAPHTDIDDKNLPEPKFTPLIGGTLKVAVIGALSAIKGADILENVAKLAAKNKLKIQFHLIGYAYRHLQTQPNTNLIVHGEYNDADLPAILQKISPDIIWLPAQWPETYSYTLSAALSEGYAVAVTDIGAFTERVKNRPYSWTLPWDSSAQDWLEFFQKLQENQLPEDNLSNKKSIDEQKYNLPKLNVENDFDKIEKFTYERGYIIENNIQGNIEDNIKNLVNLFINTPAPETSPDYDKSNLYKLAAKLQRMPIMSKIVKMISPQMRAKIKDWL